jgi:L-ascorbate metabolism protein UlaG (beta-lactamase superfamily)
MANVTITWLGHAGFRIEGAGKRVYVDAWLDAPTFPESERDIERIDVLALTHGHGDHAGSAVDLAKRHSPQVVAMNELAGWLGSQGVENATGFNKGGTVEVDGVRITMTDARHSGGGPDGSYVGEAAGLVVELDGKRIYHAGDTCVFGDMELIGRLYEPDVAILPIGDHFTMGPREAALALELLGTKRCIPCHYGTFPLLAGTPDELAKLAPGVEIVRLEPGQSAEV